MAAVLPTLESDEHFPNDNPLAAGGTLPHHLEKFHLPRPARDFARRFFRRHHLDPARTIVLVPSAGQPHSAVDLSLWQRVVERLPEFSFLLTGRTVEQGQREGSSYSVGVPEARLKRFLAAFPDRFVNAFDQPLLYQSALIQRAALFLAMHTGMAWIANAARTPIVLMNGYGRPPYFADVPCVGITADLPCVPCEGKPPDQVDCPFYRSLKRPGGRDGERHGVRSLPRPGLCVTPEYFDVDGLVRAVRVVLSGQWTVEDNHRWWLAEREGRGPAYVRQRLEENPCG
jgi:hypothetical protein